MKRKRFTEEQIIGVLKEYAAGASIADLSRQHGLSEHTLYRWKAKYGNMEVSEASQHLYGHHRTATHNYSATTTH